MFFFFNHCFFTIALDVQKNEGGTCGFPKSDNGTEDGVMGGRDLAAGGSR